MRGTLPKPGSKPPKKTPEAIRPARPGDIRHSCADISRIRRDLAYEPTVAFETGLAHTLAWYRQQSS